MESKNDVFANKRDKNDFIIALVVIVFFSLFIYLFVFKTTEKEADTSIELNEPLKKTVAIVEKQEDLDKYKIIKIKAEDSFDSKVVEAIVLSDVIDNVSESVPLKVESQTIDISKDEVKIKEKTVTEESLIKEESLTAVLSDDNRIEESSIDLQKEEEPLVEENKVSIEDLSEDIVEKEVKEEGFSKIKEVEPIKETPTILKEAEENFDCVIIVGAFKEVANKKGVITKLSSLGYNYTEGVLRKGLNYVGVPINCNDKQEKQKLLSELNEAFGIESWVKKK